MTESCSVDGCDRAITNQTNRMCAAHYKRYVKHGNPGPAEIREKRPPARGALCAVEGCEKRCVTRGWCSGHYQRFLIHGSPDHPYDYRPPRGEKSPFWSGRDIGYTPAHRRIARQRGPARNFKCLCGARAQHWAYDHEDELELVDERGLRYSADPAHYVPMCAPCHSRFDRQARENHVA